ncbi:MAG TPA: DNA mismatch repair endonuclease MutL [Bacteroidia bacterium]|nr:DNA mismatch repair endonuclease MutL [Bacteroidia bacterium]
MPNLIQLLPEHIASKIAAGEVIQRPSSVFKELVENSIDAKATRIDIIVKEGGKDFLQVSDNGIGMSPEDARMCFEKHATSKIKSVDDLFNILTKGFRGEALASIAAVARVELKTKPEDAELGTKIVIEDGKILINEPCACQKGTTISVQNLFFNLPARKNFLKDDAIEFKHIVDEFERLVIPHYNIHFTLTHNDKMVFNLPSTNNLFSRLEYFIDNTSKEKFISIQDSTPAFELKAYIGNPEVAKKKRSYQMIFINNRFVKNNFLTHAVYEAFKGLIPPDYHPQFFLFFNIHPSRIDWNIHPAKIEARLLDEKLIYPFLVSVIKKGLGVSGITQTIEFSKPPDIDMRDVDSKKTAPPPEIKIDPNYSPFRSSSTSSSSSQKVSSASWEEYYKIFQESKSPANTIKQESLNLDITSTIECFQWAGKYIVCNFKESLLILDQHRAHEKILYEKLKNYRHNISSQQILFPIHVDLSPNDFTLIQQLFQEFRELGFQIDEFGNNSVIINAYPDIINPNEIKEILENSLENFRINQITELKDVHENFYRSLAKSSAIKYGHILTKSEMMKLIEDLFALEDYLYSPSGKTILKEISKDEINSFFKK